MLRMIKLLGIILCTLLLWTAANAGINNPGASGGGVTPNLGRVTINVDPSIEFANLAKGIGFFVSPSNCASPPCADANGNPNQTPTSVIFFTAAFPAGYYGTLTWSWSGTGEMETAGPPMIVLSGGGAITNLSGASSGDITPGNVLVSCASFPTCNGATNPSIVYEYGWNIQSISSGAGGVITVNTKTNFVNSTCYGQSGTATNGQVGPLVNITGANANTGANSLWAITNCTASSFDLLGSTFTNAQAAAGGTGIIAASNVSIYFPNSGTYSGFSNLVIAETPNISVINAGHYWDPVYVSQMKTLMNPNGTCVTDHSCGWLRFMDYSAVQNNFEKDFANRLPATALSYNQTRWYPSGYQVGTIANTSDALTASDPSTSTWSGSAYLDGAIVQGTIASTNTTVVPTLNVGGHGAKPIVSYADSMPMVWIILNGTPATPGTDTMTFTFSAGGAAWFNSGSSCVVTYTTQANDSTELQFDVNLFNWLNGGTVGGNTPVTCLNSSGVTLGNPENTIGPMLFPPSAQAGRLIASYSSTPDPTTVSIGKIRTSALNATGVQNFIYSYLLDAWIYINSATGFPAVANPMEAAIDLANQVGANVWWNFGTNSSAYVQSVVQTFGNPSTGLTSGLRFGFETGNEVWNCFGPNPCPVWKTFGNALGIASSSNASNFNYTGLRTAQYASVAQTAWTGQGRNASDFYVLIMAQADNEVANGNFDNGQLKGSSLNNTFVSTYGALGGGPTAINFTTPGNRPVDSASHVGIGLAPYWGSPWWGPAAANLVGAVSGNAPWLQAQLDYVNGNTSLAFTEISNTFNGTTARTDGQSAGGSQYFNVGTTSQNLTTMATSMEAIAAEYDTFRTGAGLTKIARFNYEGAPQWSFSSNATNGTNSATDATSISALTTQITNLGWNVSAYTHSGTNTISELVTQILTFAQAWKNDPSYASLIDTYNYQVLTTISGANREVHPAQFGYNANTWGLFPSDYHANNPYQNYNAISTWNAGN